MRNLKAFVTWLRIGDAQSDIAVAQFNELKRQVPLLYLLLSVNAVAVAYTHHGLAPAWLTVAVPAALILVSSVRALTWVRRRHHRPEPAEAVAEMRRIVVLSSLISAAFVAWALWLAGHGGPFEQGHIALFIAVTVVGCIICLMHLPQAAITVTAVVTVPYLGYYLTAGNAVFVAVAMNVVLVTAVLIRVVLNNYGGFAQLVRSRAETERLGRENARLAHTDALTGLPNRRRFFTELDEWIEAARRDGSTFAVGLLDLDRFKPVNDTHGHVVGDRLLAEIGGRLGAAAGSGTLVARLGGDEFGFLVAGAGAEAQAHALREALCEPVRLDGITIAVGCSCGLALYPDAGDAAHVLFDRADYALYNVKAGGRGSVTLYSSAHERRISSERAVETAFRTANLERELDVHFQPIVDLATDRTVAVEALARWTSPTLGTIGPDVFMAVAERAGLVHDLTLALLRKALLSLRQLPADLDLSFNLSAHDVASPRTVLAVVAALNEAGVDPARLVFEITETALMRDFEAAEQSIRLLRSLGARIALDDFGTGYSSLGYLHRLPIDEIKVDRSFVRGAGEPAGVKLLASILTLSASLDLACVAEGVETAAERALLGKLGCTLCQGYLFARPMPADALLAWLGNEGVRRSA